MSGPLASPAMRRLERLFGKLGFIDRHYVVDFQIVVSLLAPYEHVARFAPAGTRAERVDGEHGVIYLTYMRMTAGNLISDAHPKGIERFDELLWGIRIQPVERKWYLPGALVASALTTTHEVSRRVLRERDNYHVRTLPDLDLRFEPDVLRFSARDASTTFCSFDLSSVAPSDRRWLLSPSPTEVVIPPITRDDPALRYEFVGAGFLQILRGVQLPAAEAFGFGEHPFFENPIPSSGRDNFFAGGFATGRLRPLEIVVSRPETPGLQMLTPSRPLKRAGSSR